MTGVRVPLCPIPAGYVPHHEEHGPDWSNPWSCAASFVTALRRCVNGPDQAPINVPTSPTVDQSRISPVCKLSFDAEPHDPPNKSAPPDITAAEQQLLVKTLSASKSKLDLESIADWVTDLKSAVAQVDGPAHALLTTTDWSSLLSGPNKAPQAIKANKRLSLYILASLDADGDNVKLLKDKLRTADRTDRPGILTSGMDMLAEVLSLVDGRSIGEIKLTKDNHTKVTFQLGMSLTSTRLKATLIRKNFALRTPAERAVPNALHHEMIAKIPDTGNDQLTLKKQKYEDDLYKSEMRQAAPPWTLTELVDEIAVDLARASQEVSLTERRSNTHSDSQKCPNCAGDHHPRECTTKCPDCHHTFCPGNPVRGMLCAARADTQPSKCDPPLTNISGKPLPKFIIEFLDKSWLVKHPDRELSALEVMRPDACPDCSDDDD